MKKLAVVALAASLAATSSQAAVQPAGDLVAVKIAGAVILVSAATAMIINHEESTLPIDPVNPPDPKCAGTDPLVNGFCIGNGFKTIVTSSGTGTATRTITVPVTFTYKPV